MLALAGQMVLPRCFISKRWEMDMPFHEYVRMFEDEETNRRYCDAAFSPVSMMMLVFHTAGCAVRQPFLVLQRHVVEYLRRLSLRCAWWWLRCCDRCCDRCGATVDKGFSGAMPRGITI